MKKIIVVVVGGVLALGLTGCGVSPENPSPAPSTTHGKPFLEQWLHDLTAPPTTTQRQPESWVDVMLPPEFQQ